MGFRSSKDSGSLFASNAKIWWYRRCYSARIRNQTMALRIGRELASWMPISSKFSHILNSIFLLFFFFLVSRPAIPHRGKEEKSEHEKQISFFFLSVRCGSFWILFRYYSLFYQKLIYRTPAQAKSSIWMDSLSRFDKFQTDQTESRFWFQRTEEEKKIWF